MIDVLSKSIYLCVYALMFTGLLKSFYFYLAPVGVMEILAVLVSLMISNILSIPTVIIPSRWKTPYNVADSYNCQNPFYVHGMLNDKKESKYALPIRKNGELKSFLFLRKIMILWLGVYFTYLGMQYLNSDINSTVIEILLDISLAFMIMARSCMWIYYVKFYKKNYKCPTDKEGNWAPFSFLCQNINMYYENPVCYRDLQIHSDVMEKDFGIYQYINTYKAPRNGKTFFYRYDKTDEIHILAYVKTDLFQEADIGKLNKAFVEFWKQYIKTEEEKKKIYFSFVLEVEDDNRVLKSIVRNNSGIMMYKRRYRLGAVYNRYYNRLEILPVYRYSRYKKQYEKMKKDLLDCLGISDVVQA